jgi:hypothetical protein
MGTSLERTPKKVRHRLSLAGPFRGTRLGGDGGFRQREHLVKRSLVSDEIGLSQPRASVFEFFRLKVEAAANGGIGVVAQAFGVADGNQKEIQGQRTAVAPAQVVMADQPMVNPTEAGGHLAQPVRTEEAFVNHSVSALMVR